MGWREIEPGRETGKARPIALHVGDRCRGNKLGALRAKQVRVADH